jgi:hypothetical protein
MLRATHAHPPKEAAMRKLVSIALAAGAIVGMAGAASAQQFYFGFSPGPPPGPRPYYGPDVYPGPHAYGGPPPYRRGYQPRYYPEGPRAYPVEPRYYQYGEAGYYRPGRYRTWNGCQPNWTVQDGLCKPYRGY